MSIDRGRGRTWNLMFTRSGICGLSSWKHGLYKPQLNLSHAPTSQKLLTFQISFKAWWIFKIAAFERRSFCVGTQHLDPLEICTLRERDTSWQSEKCQDERYQKWSQYAFHFCFGSESYKSTPALSKIAMLFLYHQEGRWFSPTALFFFRFKIASKSFWSGLTRTIAGNIEELHVLRLSACSSSSSVKIAKGQPRLSRTWPFLHPALIQRGRLFRDSHSTGWRARGCNGSGLPSWN